MVGLGVGLAAATGGRVTDAMLMRLVDALLAFPLLLLLILGATLVGTAAVIIGNLVSDVLYAVVDPRVRRPS